MRSIGDPNDGQTNADDPCVEGTSAFDVSFEAVVRIRLVGSSHCVTPWFVALDASFTKRP